MYTDASMSFWLIFVAGITGGITCLAVQGSLLASTIAAGKEEKPTFSQGFKATIAFSLGKLFIFTLLGILLGLLGQTALVSDKPRAVFQLVAGLYMLAVAGHLLNLHPAFRYAIIQPPALFSKLIRRQSKSADFFSPLLLGILTVLIPCGTTLAMEAYSISLANPLTGALTMFIFILGTLPWFFALGLLTTYLRGTLKKLFYTVAAILLVYFGLSAVNGSLILLNSPVSLNPIQIELKKLINTVKDPAGNYAIAATTNDGIQSISIKALPTGYNPDYLQVKAGVPVKLSVATEGGLGCTSTFVIPELKVTQQLEPGKPALISFTPEKKGKINWTCSMGMYSGIIEVI